MLQPATLTSDEIAQAQREIDPVFLATPQVDWPGLDRALGCSLTLKIETLNPIRSFKGRGASLLVRRHGARGPLVSASAGNWGQGLAYACGRSKVPLTIFASVGANRLKVARMRELGATVHLHGDDFDAAKAEAEAFAAAASLRFVADGRDREAALGAGTIAAELTSAAPFDAVLVPLGNGALLTGMGTWIKQRHPTTRVVGVHALGADAMAASWRAGRPIVRACVDTIADGIAVRVPEPYALKDMVGVVDDVVGVDDEAIVSAMRLLLEHAGQLAEPAGAAGVAALVAHPERWRGARVAVPLCGNNLTMEQIAAWLS
ncbi:threonine/serine dehydratase [Bosea eneae]|uniref:Threonine/serine dehydratase n=1 Tax=Bosea eneae TaxID=151454 RepID=A0ABW0IX83_9HYPH